jgi:hypothetical protein
LTFRSIFFRGEWAGQEVLVEALVINHLQVEALIDNIDLELPVVKIVVQKVIHCENVLKVSIKN